MRLSVILCAAGLTAVSAFAPIGSQAGVTSSGLRASENNFEDDAVVASFDPLNLANDEESLSVKSSGSAMSLAAATTAAWVASADVASANDSPDWGIFEGVSSHMLICVLCPMPFSIYMRVYFVLACMLYSTRIFKP